MDLLWDVLFDVIHKPSDDSHDFNVHTDAETVYSRLSRAAELAKVVWMIQDGEINDVAAECPE